MRFGFASTRGNSRHRHFPTIGQNRTKISDASGKCFLSVEYQPANKKKGDNRDSETRPNDHHSVDRRELEDGLRSYSETSSFWRSVEGEEVPKAGNTAEFNKRYRRHDPGGCDPGVLQDSSCCDYAG